MELGKQGIASPRVVVMVTMVLLLVMISGVSSVRYIVGKDFGWAVNVNYTTWAQDKHFYLGDWLFFVYDRNTISVLEVNKTAYDQCIESDLIHNWTTGHGRDVTPLNETKRYYFISGKGFCFSGVKLSVLVENPPPPPSSTPPLKQTSGSASSTLSSNRGHYHIVLPAAFAIAALWDSFLRFC
ncbi:lamin-like protein [Macadamia integrifolia]|uniref:lamin-like protein n=1 Tax=Macadamia integrifolia TaxID=60698 RepID=UPI001C5023F9|nr:lamin-like protein [Macadamia integrifolia]